MSLHDLIETDAINLFTSTDDFGEVIGYRVGLTVDRTDITVDDTDITVDATETTRTINAVVFREEISIVSEDGDTVLPVWEVHVANDSTYGISSTELNIGGDMLSFPPRDGQPAEEKTITRLLGQDHGMLILQCR